MTSETILLDGRILFKMLTITLKATTIKEKT